MSVEILKNEILKKHTSYGVGGPASEFIKVSDPENLREIWIDTLSEKIPHLILGKGSNLLLSDLGFRGRVILFTGEQTIFLNEKNETSCFVRVDAGKVLSDLIKEAAEHGFQDLENLSGIPGTLGGAIRGNAGAFNSEMGTFVETVDFIDETGQKRTLKKADCLFEYRESIFKKNPNWFVISALLKVGKKDEPEKILKRIKNLTAERWAKYPLGKFCGSFFKNPIPGKVFAGQLLEEANAKGDTIGDAEVSSNHANFLVNKGNATQADILKLARKWKQIVFEKSGHTLEPEVFICDERGKKIEL